MSRLEKNILDRFVNGLLLGKRKIGKPFKYNVEAPWKIGRYIN